MLHRVGAALLALLWLLGRVGRGGAPDAGRFDRFLQIGLRRIVPKTNLVSTFGRHVATANTCSLIILGTFLRLRYFGPEILRLRLRPLHVFLLLPQLDVEFKLLNKCLLGGLAEVEPLREHGCHQSRVLAITHDKALGSGGGKIKNK